jgi:hypothetical protein
MATQHGRAAGRRRGRSGHDLAGSAARAIERARLRVEAEVLAVTVDPAPAPVDLPVELLALNGQVGMGPAIGGSQGQAIYRLNLARLAATAMAALAADYGRRWPDRP